MLGVFFVSRPLLCARLSRDGVPTIPYLLVNRAMPLFDAARVPLEAVQENAAPAKKAAKPSTTEKPRDTTMMRTELADKLLLDAASNAPWVMLALTGTAQKARCATGSGAAALRACGYHMDSFGGIQFDAEHGNSLVAQVHRERAINEALNRKLAGVRDQLIAAQRELAEERDQTRAKCDRLRAECEVERKRTEPLAEQLQHTQAELDRTTRRLGRVDKWWKAAQKIAEVWRGRGRTAIRQKRFLQATLPIEAEWSEHFKKLLKGSAPPEQKHLRELWECQLRCLVNKSQRCRWNPAVLSWCADVWRRNRAAYEAMAYGGVLLLPHPDTVRKYVAHDVSTPGHDRVRYEELGESGATKGWTDEERQFILKHDEINTYYGLAWRKVGDSYQFHGLASKSTLDELFPTPKSTASIDEQIGAQLATHALVFQITSVGRGGKQLNLS